MIHLIYGDSRLVLKSIKDEVVDLVLTSPPYNLNIDYNIYNDSMSYGNYLSFIGDVMCECVRVMKNGARLCINIGNNSIYGRNFTIADVHNILTRLGLLYRNNIVWNKNQIPKRTTWGSWMSASSPYLIEPYEFILVYSKGTYSKRLDCKSDISRDEFIRFTNSLWTIAPSKITNHPASFPEELVYRLVKLYTVPDDLVLDPFIGSGTTAVVCRRTNRSCIGIDIDRTYISMSKNRVDNYRLVQSTL